MKGKTYTDKVMITNIRLNMLTKIKTDNYGKKKGLAKEKVGSSIRND